MPGAKAYIWEISVCSSLFCSEPESSLKYLFKKMTSNSSHLLGTFHVPRTLHYYVIYQLNEGDTIKDSIL